MDTEYLYTHMQLGNKKQHGEKQNVVRENLNVAESFCQLGAERCQVSLGTVCCCTGGILWWYSWMNTSVN